MQINGARYRMGAKLVAGGLFVGGGLWAWGAQVAGLGAAQQSARHDVAQELQLKITAPFTLASVGDIFAGLLPISQLEEPRLQSLLKILRDADIGIANAESSIVDLPRFSGPLTDMVGDKAAAKDIRAMGIRMVNRANNHTDDQMTEGMLSTNALLTEAGVVHAGTGRTLEEARDAAYYMTSKGRVGLVGVMPISENAPGGDTGFKFLAAAATSRNGNMGGRPGLNPLKLTTYNTVTAEQMEALKKIRDTVMARVGETPAPIAAPKESADRLDLFGTHYKVGPKPGDLSYEMDANDLRDNLKSIKNGKLFSDLMVVSVHAHQGHLAFQSYSFDNGVPDFLVEFAHKSIDNGADVFLAQGVHTLRGVEIYKGKPIFYGVSNFTLFMNSPVGGEEVTNLRNEMTRAERGQGGLARLENLEAILVTSRFEGGRLTEVRIHPADLGKTNRPISKIGIPMVPSPEVAQQILAKMQAISKPFGTNIAIENGVGVIRVGATPSTSGGAR